MTQGSFKDFENVRLIANEELRFGDKTIQAGETFAFFDRIQIAGLQEEYSMVAATGGYANRGLVYWVTQKEVPINFTQGVFSIEQLSLMLNREFVKKNEDDPLYITKREYLESDENGWFELQYAPVNLFVYDKRTGERLPRDISGKRVHINGHYQTVIVDYTYNYNNGRTIIRYDNNELISGYVSLEGQTRYKDDDTGVVYTVLIKIPLLKLLGDLKMRLGDNATPLVANFKGVCEPTGYRKDGYTIEFIFLEDDLNSDIM